MVYIPKNADAEAVRNSFSIAEIETLDFPISAPLRAWIRPNGAGFVEATDFGFALTQTTVPYATDVWQEWGASTFGFSVNGVSRSGIASLTSGGVDFVDLNNGVATSGSLFLNAVLPPTTGGVPETAHSRLWGRWLCRFVAAVAV
jgi:hypothetical protein